jgi:predicted PurR-regulated permease PerM
MSTENENHAHAGQASRLDRVRSTAYLVWTAIGVLALLYAAGWLLGQITAAIVPFLMAGIIAFLLHAPVNALEDRGIGRGWAVLICFAVVLGALIIAGIFLFPPLGKQIQAFATEVPAYLDKAQRAFKDLQMQFSRVAIPGWLSNVVDSVLKEIGTFMRNLASGAGKMLVAAGTGVVTGVFDMFLATVLAFWILKDTPTIRRELVRVAGPSFEDDAENLVRTVDHVVGGYLKGQTIASLVTGTAATIGLAIIGVPYALVLGIIVFIFNYVPYVGPILAGIVAGVVGLFVSPLTGLLAVVIVVVAQNLTDTLVTPRVMSNQVNLHPTFVIFALLVGGALFGIPGMLLAIPVAATIQGLFIYYYERKTSRQLSTEDGALFRVESGTLPEESPEPTPEDASDKPGKGETT